MMRSRQPYGPQSLPQSSAEQQRGQDRNHGNADDRWHVILFSRRHFCLLRLCALEPASKGGTPAAFPGKGLKTGVPLATARVLGQTRRRKTYAQKSGSFLASLLTIKDRERDPSRVEAAAP
jgi:hypothetical protein